jgi:hypothetical protein
VIIISEAHPGADFQGDITGIWRFYYCGRGEYGTSRPGIDHGIDQSGHWDSAWRMDQH